MVRINSGEKVSNLSNVKRKAKMMNHNYECHNGLYRKILDSLASYKDSGEYSFVIKSPYSTKHILTFLIKVQSDKKVYNRQGDKCMYQVKVMANDCVVKELSSRGRYIMSRQLYIEYKEWMKIQRGFEYYNVLAA